MDFIRREFFPSFLGKVEFGAALSRSNFMVELVLCSTGVVIGVGQVVQNWFTGIPNPTRSSGYDEIARSFLIGEEEFYSSSVTSFLSGGCRVRSGPFQIQFWRSSWTFIALG